MYVSSNASVANNSSDAAAAAAADSTRLFDELLDVEVAMDMPRLRDAARLGVPAAVRHTVYSYLLGIALVDRSAEVTMERVQERDFCRLVDASRAMWRSGSTSNNSSSSAGGGSSSSNNNSSGSVTNNISGVNNNNSSVSNNNNSSNKATTSNSDGATTGTTAAGAGAAGGSSSSSSSSSIFAAALQRRIDAATLTRVLQHQYSGNNDSMHSGSSTGYLAALQSSASLADYGNGKSSTRDVVGIANSNNNSSSSSGGVMVDASDDVVRCQAAWCAALRRVQQHFVLQPQSNSDMDSNNYNCNYNSSSNNSNKGSDSHVVAYGCFATASLVARVVHRADEEAVWQLRQRRRSECVARVVAALRVVHHDVPPAHVDTLMTFAMTLEHAYSLAAALSVAQDEHNNSSKTTSHNKDSHDKNDTADDDDDNGDNDGGGGGGTVDKQRAANDKSSSSNNNKDGDDASSRATAATSAVANARDVFFAVEALYALLTHHGNALQNDAALHAHCGAFLLLFHAVQRPLYEHFVREGVCAGEWLPDMLCRLLADRMHLDDVLRLWDAYVADARAQLGVVLHPYVCLAVLSTLADELLECDKEGILARLRVLPRLHAVALLHKAASLRELVREEGLLPSSSSLS